MLLEISADERAFQNEVHRFLKDNLPPRLAAAENDRSHLRRAECAEWHRILYDKGWAVPYWPVEFGGTGWNAAQRHIWEIEYGRACAPEISVIGVGLVGPVLCQYGSPDMQHRFLRSIASGEIFFCQGFSEPQAGSDLASLRTRAVRDGDQYVINGQKIWTSHAPDADMMICLCRTDPDVKPQAGLSMLIVPMDTPGVLVRHIPSIDNEHSVFEVFLEDVRVPAENLVGEENRAWTYAKFLLNNERTHNAYLGQLLRYLDRLEARAAQSEPQVRRVAELRIDVNALQWTVLRVLSEEDPERVGAAASALKVRASELLLRAAELEAEQLGLAACVDYRPDMAASALDGIADANGKASQYMYWRAASIFGGANEIQRTIIWGSLG